MNVATELGSIVAATVSKYARKCWWIDADELRQTAWVAALEAHRRWDPERGPIGPYAGTIVKRAVSAHLLHESTIVSATNRAAARRELLTTSRADLEEIARVASASTWADDLLDDKRWRVRVLARLLELVGENELGLDALTGEAPRSGRTPAWLLALKTDTRTKIETDEELRAIWKDRT